MGRVITHWNGREIRGEISQVNTERDQQDRQEEEWYILASIERREDVPIRQESHRTPPTPPLQRIDFLPIGVVWTLPKQGHYLEILL